MLQNDLGPIFPLGHVTVTPGAKKSLPHRDLLDALLCHMRGQWIGDSHAADQYQLPFALDGCRVLGAYRSSSGQKVLIITEADRSLTTVMLPEEF